MNPVSPETLGVYDPGYLVVSGGQIERLSGVNPVPDFHGAQYIDHGNKSIYPGLIDTHVHLPQFAIMGIGRGELLAWLNEYTYPEEARFGDPEYADRISRLFFDALIANEAWLLRAISFFPWDKPRSCPIRRARPASKAG